MTCDPRATAGSDRRATLPASQRRCLPLREEAGLHTPQPRSSPALGPLDALADIRDALERNDPHLAWSFHRLTPRMSPRTWAMAVAGLLMTTLAICFLGFRAIGVITIVLALSAPVVAWLATANTTPIEHSTSTAPDTRDRRWS